MNFGSILVWTYAKLCNVFLWPASRVLVKNSPSVEGDYRKAALTITFEEYISAAIFTAFFVAFEVFFLFSSFLMLFNSQAIIPSLNNTAENMTSQPIIIPAQYPDLLRISEGMHFIGERVSFSFETANESTDCSLLINGVEYDMPLITPPGKLTCVNTTDSTYCVRQLSRATSFNYTAEVLTEQAGDYAYSVACSNPAFESRGAITVFSTMQDLEVYASQYPMTFSLYEGDKKVLSYALDEDSTIPVPEGDFSIRASSGPSSTVIPLSVPLQSQVGINFPYGTLAVESSGTIFLSRGSYNETADLSNRSSFALGPGVWDYSISGNSGSSEGKAIVIENQTVLLNATLRPVTHFSVGTGEAFTDSNLPIYVNFTDEKGNWIMANIDVKLDGINATFVSLGVYSAYINSSEGERTVTVDIVSDFYGDKSATRTVGAVFNKGKQSFLDFWLQVIATLLAFVLTGFAFLMYPSQRAESRGVKIEGGLPFVLSHMASMAKSGITIGVIIKLMSKYCASDELKKEFSRMAKSMDVLGNDMIRALKVTSETTPSKKFSQILDSLATTIHSGGDIAGFLKEKANETRMDIAMKSRERTSAMALMGEIYVILFVASPILLIIMLIAMEFVAGGSLAIQPIVALKITAYMLLPMMTVGFLVFLSKDTASGI